MKRLSEKFKLIFIPFLFIAVSTVIVYTFLNWLIIIKLQLISPKEMIVNFWIPFFLPFIPIFIWLRPRLKRLHFKTKNGDPHFVYMLFATLAIAAPLMVAQSWMVAASGKLSQLDNIKQIENTDPTKYYTLKKFYIDKNNYGVHSSFDVSGKYNGDFNMHLFVALPILESEKDTLNSVCFGWIGKEYRKHISNKLAQNEKKEQFQEFSRKSEKEFNQTDFTKFVYLDRASTTMSIDGFNKSIKKCLKYNSIHSNVFLAVNEPFANRTGNKFAWIFGAFGIGAVVCFIFLLPAKFEEDSVEHNNNEVSSSTREELKDFLSFFIPREGFYITPIIIDLNILIYVIMVCSGLVFISFSASDLLAWGANFKPVTTNGEWWRLLSCTFLHGGLMHLLANMFGLLFVGIFLEPLLGKLKYLLIYLTTGILASISSLYFHDATVSIGASGAVFGIYGVFLALLLTKVFPKDFGKAFLLSTVVFIGYNLLMGFAGAGIDNAAHIGGLVSGFIIGLVLSPQLKREVEEQSTEQIISEITTDQHVNRN